MAGIVALHRPDVVVRHVAGADEKHRHEIATVHNRSPGARAETTHLPDFEAQARSCQQRNEDKRLDHHERTRNARQPRDDIHPEDEDERDHEHRAHDADQVGDRGIAPVTVVETGEREDHGAKRDEPTCGPARKNRTRPVPARRCRGQGGRSMPGRAPTPPTPGPLPAAGDC